MTIISCTFERAEISASLSNLSSDISDFNPSILKELDEKLKATTVGTPEYEKAFNQYSTLNRILVDIEKNENKREENSLKEKELNNNLKIELRKNWFEVLKVALSVFGSIAGIFIYRKIFDKTGDPFFRDIGRSILGVIRKG